MNITCEECPNVGGSQSTAIVLREMSVYMRIQKSAASNVPIITEDSAS